MKKLLAILAAIAIFSLNTVEVNASSLPVGGVTYYLSGAGITNSSNSIQLTSFLTPDGRPITMSMFGTTTSPIGYGALDVQTTSKLEDVSFTGITQDTNGTAILSGVSRGDDFVYPYTASTTLAKSHSGGSVFILTNTAGYYYNEFTMNNNNNLFTYPIASTSPATKGYVDNTAFNGAGVINANTLNRGVVQIATAAQAAASTNTGSSGAIVVLPASIATSTKNSLTAGNVIPVTQGGGQIDPNFINTTGLTYNGQVYTFPASAGATSTALSTNGSNSLTWDGYNNLISTTTGVGPINVTGSTASSTVLQIPILANSLRANDMIDSTFRFAGGSALSIPTGSTMYLEAAFGNSTTTLQVANSSGGTVQSSLGNLEFLISNNNATTSQTATLTLNTNNLGSAVSTAVGQIGGSMVVPFAATENVVQQLTLVVRFSNSSGFFRYNNGQPVTTEVLRF